MARCSGIRSYISAFMSLNHLKWACPSHSRNLAPWRHLLLPGLCTEPRIEQPKTDERTCPPLRERVWELSYLRPRSPWDPKPHLHPKQRKSSRACAWGRVARLRGPAKRFAVSSLCFCQDALLQLFVHEFPKVWRFARASFTHTHTLDCAPNLCRATGRERWRLVCRSYSQYDQEFSTLCIWAAN